MLTEQDLKRAEEWARGGWCRGAVDRQVRDDIGLLLTEVKRLNEVIESAVALAVLGDLETIKQIKVQHG